MFFVAQTGVARSFCVGHHVCLNPAIDANVASLTVILPRYRHQKLKKKIVCYQIGQKTKQVKKHFFQNCFVTQSGQAICSP